MGLVYKCISPNGKTYIGQHNTNTFNRRKYTHYKNYNRFLRQRCMNELLIKFNNNIQLIPKGFCTALYNAFFKYGINNFKWDIIQEDIPLSQLNEVEDRYIIQYNSLSPTGYNLKLNNHSKCIYSDETLMRMTNGHKYSMDRNLNKYRSNKEELQGLPKHITFFTHNTIRGYRIHNHPLCKNKQFADSNTDIVVLKQQVIDFLANLKVRYKTHREIKADNGIPKGVIEQKPGAFLGCFSKNKHRYTKYFSKGTKDENLKAAINWLNITKHNLLLNMKE